MRLVYDPEYYENETFHHFRLQALQGRHKNECIAIVRSLKWKIALDLSMYYYRLILKYL